MLTIRTAGVADAEILQQVARDTYLHHFSHLWLAAEEMEEYLAEEYGREALAASLADPAILWLLAERENQPIGFAKVWWDRPRPDNGEPGALLQKLYFLPEETGKGHGRHLLHRVIDEAKQRHQPTLWVTVLQDNNHGRDFYIKQGMVTVETLPFSSASQRSLMDVLAMPLAG
ncbi:GNAT family N-acetyltransferase [Nissabacter sp. SGAir0207]|uniref:GNAT family N-acetyltransferase n=1 Tax=Nissabacter sp. SGAir0207 TaxID=2126321 RepID=UPI00143D829E|nr:GNAT family N-acetyltransferase [Nissabacter sp. SGAir0207]